MRTGYALYQRVRRLNEPKNRVASGAVRRRLWLADERMNTVLCVGAAGGTDRVGILMMGRCNTRLGMPRLSILLLCGGVL